MIVAFQRYAIWISSLIAILCVVSANPPCAPPDCVPPPPGESPTRAEVDSDLFDTGLTAAPQTEATPRAPSGAHVESSPALTTPEGRTFTDVSNADISGDGEVERAAEISLDDVSFSDVENLDPIGPGPGHMRAERAQSVSGPEIEAEEVEDIEIEPDGDLRISKARKAAVGDIVAHDAEGISRRDGVIRIAKSSKIEISDGILADAEHFEGSGVSFHVGAARDVVNGCLLLHGVWDSDFHVSEGSLRVKPASGVSFTISDCRFSQSQFEAFSGSSSLEISKSRAATYEISEGKLTCHDLDATEIVEAHASASISYGDHCISCVTIDPSGTYWLNSNLDVGRDFGLHIPDKGTRYRLCLKKEPLAFFQTYDGLVDYTANRIELAGIVSYLRLPVENGTPTSLLMQPVYEGLDKNNQAVIELDDRQLHITRLHLSNRNPSSGILSWAYHGPYGIYELHENNQTKRFGRFLDGAWPPLIERYSSDFGTAAGNIRFIQGVLVQETNQPGGDPTRQEMVCDGCSGRGDYTRAIDEIKSELAAAADRCGI